MPLLAEYRAGTVSSEDFSRSVTVIDTYIFRRFVCGYATNALNKIFATAYREITRMRRNGDQFSDVLIYSLSKRTGDRKSTRLNSSHVAISYAVFCLKKKR